MPNLANSSASRPSTTQLLLYSIGCPVFTDSDFEDSTDDEEEDTTEPVLTSNQTSTGTITENVTETDPAMTRGTGAQSKVHFQGKDEDFIVYVDSAKAVQDWLKDRSIPLAQVVSGFKIFVTHKHGAQGVNDEASKSTLANEFGTHNEDECIIKILEGGSIQETESAERQGSKNDSMGTRAAH